MNALFTINFRREAYQRELARARRRVILLGVWVAYFGVIGVVMGLYGLNCMSLNRRVALLERQSERMDQQQGAAADWTVRPGEVTAIEGYVQNPRRWRNRLLQLSTLLPPTVKVTSLAVNPQNLNAGAEQNKLVITGIVRPSAGQDRMQSVMHVVATLHDDSLFAAGYRNIKLASTRVLEGSDGGAEFVIECR
jgi:Tfp pilus assembly protein PilN